MKRAEMGVGTLIVFIAMLLVAAIAAGVIISTQSALQEKSLSTSQQARSQVSSHMRTYEVSATDANNGSVKDFCQIIKLTPGSDPMKLNQIMLSLSTKDDTAVLKYRGKNSVCEHDNSNGYNTYYTEKFGRLELSIKELVKTEAQPLGPTADHTRDTIVDLDRDGLSDYIRTCSEDGGLCDPKYNDHYFQFNLSNHGNNKIFYVKAVNDDGTVVDLANDAAFNFTHLNITDKSGTYHGYIKAWRSDSASMSDGMITHKDEDVRFQIYSPERLDDDLNDDGRDDFLGFNRTHAFVIMDDEQTFELGADISTSSYINIDSAEIISDDEVVGYLTMKGDADNDIIYENATAKIVPEKINTGYFSAVYQTEGNNHIHGRVQRGDVVKLCYEAPQEILTDKRVRISLIPKSGSPTLTEFITPEVMSRTREYLYP